ncbi:MAG: Crp/Fnr family transcriptional regulator [Ignavibacteria bacterium]|nr:Crp/Fnr family transcriptional regulator [Ignavibacteria bacterium]
MHTEVSEVDFLRQVSIFSGLTDEDVVRVANIGSIKVYQKGSVIVMEAEAGAAMFSIISGKVKVVRSDGEGREVILSILSESDVFGELSLLDGHARSASVIAITETEVFVIHRLDFMHLVHTFPSISLALLGELAHRLRKADAQIKNLSLKGAEDRVASVILQLAEEVGRVKYGRVIIEDIPLQQDLANMAGTSRETFSRMLHQFIKAGEIILDSDTFIINDYEKFRHKYR